MGWSPPYGLKKNIYVKIFFLLLIIIFYFENVAFFLAKLGSDFCPRVDNQTTGDTLQDLTQPLVEKLPSVIYPWVLDRAFWWRKPLPFFNIFRICVETRGQRMVRNIFLITMPASNCSLLAYCLLSLETFEVITSFRKYPQNSLNVSFHVDMMILKN